MKHGYVPLVGGPLDGQAVRSDGHAWTWVDKTGRRHEEAGPKRYLYREVAKGRDRVLFWAGYTHVVCETCGCYLLRSTSCRYCGARLV